MYRLYGKVIIELEHFDESPSPRLTAKRITQALAFHGLVNACGD
jgi:hypothetical protein